MMLKYINIFIGCTLLTSLTVHSSDTHFTASKDIPTAACDHMPIIKNLTDSFRGNPTLFKQTFSSDALDALHEGQSPDKLLPHIDDRSGIVAATNKEGNILAAMLHWPTKDGQEYIKAIAITPSATEEEIKHALRGLTKEVRGSCDKRRMLANVTTKHNTADQRTQRILGILTNNGFQEKQRFIRLTKNCIPDPTFTVPPTFRSSGYITDESEKLQLQKDTCQILTTPDIIQFFECTPEIIQLYSTHPTCYNCVTYDDNNQPIGALIYQIRKHIHPESKIESKNGYIEFIGVMEQYRRQKIASLLIAYTIQQLTEQNIKTVEINVLETNERAFKCYTNPLNGFEPISRLTKITRSASTSPQPAPMANHGETIPPFNLSATT